MAWERGEGHNTANIEVEGVSTEVEKQEGTTLVQPVPSCVEGVVCCVEWSGVWGCGVWGVGYGGVDKIIHHHTTHKGSRYSPVTFRW